MIDLLHNTASGVHLVHDEPGLATAVAFHVGRDGRCSLGLRGGGSFPVQRRVPSDMLADVRKATSLRAIRLDGFRVVQTADLPIEAA